MSLQDTGHVNQDTSTLLQPGRPHMEHFGPFLATVLLVGRGLAEGILESNGDELKSTKHDLGMKCERNEAA